MPKSSKAQDIARVVKGQTLALAALAKEGNKTAALELCRTAALATEWLTRLCREKPKLFAPIAARRFSWPVMYGAHRDTITENQQLIEQLELASDTDVNFSLNGKPYEWKLPANQIAIFLYQLAKALKRRSINEWNRYERLTLTVIGTNGFAGEQYRRDLERWGLRGPGQLLPRLLRNTAETWARATPDFVRLVYGPSFDEHLQLQQLKNSVMGRAKTSAGEQGESRRGTRLFANML
jgi:hypothetical protein